MDILKQYRVILFLIKCINLENWIQSVRLNVCMGKYFYSLILIS